VSSNRHLGGSNGKQCLTDGSDNTYWQSNGTKPHWIRLHLDAGREREKERERERERKRERKKERAGV
jgi:hypothetical protein